MKLLKKLKHKILGIPNLDHLPDINNAGGIRSTVDDHVDKLNPKGYSTPFR